MKNKKAIILSIVFIIVAITISILIINNKKKENPIGKLSNTRFYIIEGDVQRARELLNNYDYLNERNLPNHKGLIAKEVFTYYDESKHEVLSIRIMELGDECIITTEDGKEKYYDMKKKDTSKNKFNVSILTLDPNNGKEEEIAYKFLNLIEDDKEIFTYDPKTTGVQLLYKPNKSIKVENNTNVEPPPYRSVAFYTIYHNFSIYSFDTEKIANEVYEKYVTDLKKYCDKLNPNQIKTRSFKIENEQFCFMYDNYNSAAQGIIGTHKNEMFIFNFHIFDEYVEENEEYTRKYFDLLIENGYFKNNEIKDFVMNLFKDKNLYNKENYDN